LGVVEEESKRNVPIDRASTCRSLQLPAKALSCSNIRWSGITRKEGCLSIPGILTVPLKYSTEKAVYACKSEDNCAFSACRFRGAGYRRQHLDMRCSSQRFLLVRFAITVGNFIVSTSFGSHTDYPFRKASTCLSDSKEFRISFLTQRNNGVRRLFRRFFSFCRHRVYLTFRFFIFGKSEWMSSIDWNTCFQSCMFSQKSLY
jgi:hypothetical protein